MKIYIPCFIALTFLNGCFHGRSASRIFSNTFITTIPVIKTDGSIVNLKNSVHISLYADVLMYEFRHLFNSIDMHGAEHRWLDKMFLIHKTGENHGLLYHVASQSAPLKVSVDSVLKSIAISPTKWENVLAFPPHSSIDLFSEIAIDTYVFGPSSSINHIDSAFFYYSRSRSQAFFFSLSPKLDSAKKKILYKIEMVQNPVFSNQLKKIIPRRVLKYQLDLIWTDNLDPEEKLQYFKRFEKDIMTQ